MSSRDLSAGLLDALEHVQGIDEAASRIAEEAKNGNTEDDPMGNIAQEFPDVKITDKESSVEDEESSDVVVDYNRARSATYSMQDIMLIMLKNACTMAVATAHPRAYGVVNEMMTTMRGLNKDLLDIQKAMLESKGKFRTLPAVGSEPPVPGEGVEGQVTTPDGTVLTISAGRPSSKNILKMLKEMKENGVDLDSLDNSDLLEAAKTQDELEVQETGVENGSE